MGTCTKSYILSIYWGEWNNGEKFIPATTTKSFWIISLWMIIWTCTQYTKDHSCTTEMENKAAILYLGLIYLDPIKNQHVTILKANFLNAQRYHTQNPVLTLACSNHIIAIKKTLLNTLEHKPYFKIVLSFALILFSLFVLVKRKPFKWIHFDYSTCLMAHGVKVNQLENV